MKRAEEIGARTDHETLVELATVASGAVELPIATTYPLDRVADAFAELEQRHTRGKIVLIPRPKPRAIRGGWQRRRTAHRRLITASDGQ
ncbi:zinc-binding dehydrogenase [Streptomyces sp. NPDC059441]|uniref:zinc-binding dehydrogenase n=1 Tax=Streptomyces sp. NPDC059441 TaxID=3346829 RepID=UPI0036ADC093